MVQPTHKVNVHADRALRQFFATLVLGASILATAQAQELSFTLHEQLVIGDDEEAPSEYLFYFPEIVRTDSKGNIYVKDALSAVVRVFDANGQYVTTVGKRGEGPGELRELFSMHVDGDDRIIVTDRMSRRLTIFTDMGKSFATKSLAEDGRTIQPRPILSLDNSFVLTYVTLFANPEGGPSIKDDRVLHTHDTDFNRLETFAQLDDIYDLDDPFLNAYSTYSSAMNVATNGTDTIVLSPYVYDGYIYRYTRSNDMWVMEKLKGGPVPKRSFMPVSEKDIDTNPDVKRGAVMLSGPTGTYRARIFSRSDGVAILSTGEILHFPRRTPLKQDFEPRAELFNQNGDLVGYGQLLFDNPELNGNARVMESIRIQWIDTADRLYLARKNGEGFFVLSVANLEISSK
ncbi:MAG: 6-bladed beta-propeller [Rhodothermaceae bacterium]|nr:6-bladed beta-propeller [Rhodothermaceae bacterium]MYD55578.1 6-bladed beta-propeller [Rhodothermaceae bacterium]